MNKLYRVLERFFHIDEDIVEEPKPTTEFIRTRIEGLRKESAESAALLEKKREKIKDSLKTFPVGLPASATEIAGCYPDPIFDILTQSVLDQLVRTDSSSWEYVSVDGCTLYQRT